MVYRIPITINGQRILVALALTAFFSTISTFYHIGLLSLPEHAVSSHFSGQLGKLQSYPSDDEDFDGHFRSQQYWLTPDGNRIEPIEQLFINSYNSYRQFLNRQSKTLKEAIINYQVRYNRDPPPGFDEWFTYAKEKNAVVIDDYDRIEDSLEVYRLLPAEDFEKRMNDLRAYDVNNRISEFEIKDGVVSVRGGDGWHIASLYEYSHRLPDLKLLFNGYDEPFVFATANETEVPVDFWQAAGEVWWGRLMEKCRLDEKFRAARRKNHGTVEWARRVKGAERYIGTMDEAKDALDICKHPESREMHGFFNGPTSLTATNLLVPIASVARIEGFKDLLLPSGYLLDTNYMGNEGVKDWDFKQKKLFWRGSPTGGFLDGENVFKMHRIRLAVMAQKFTDLIDAKITGYFENPHDTTLQALMMLRRFFERPERAEKSEENTFGYLMDMDGNGESGRYYRLLRSKAVVFKLTAFQEWHDDRLFPWVHYVPIRLGMPELVNVIKWMSKTERGLEISRRIAEESNWWARTALRPEDAAVYTYRLLLEYAELFRKK
ncbi:F-actin-capping protein subunit beta [Orbilia ellipsospora]|uniref:F-actin-capping protein subunit beta n=1 Tax=Orbilia ellipsospora TaxID=2528407 RepID=A0AAV9XRH5_9PEZI